MSFTVMTREKFDTDRDNAIDIAEGIRVVTEFPVSPKVGDMILKDGQIYICTDTD